MLLCRARSECNLQNRTFRGDGLKTVKLMEACSTRRSRNSNSSKHQLAQLVVHLPVCKLQASERSRPRKTTWVLFCEVKIARAAGVRGTASMSTEMCQVSMGMAFIDFYCALKELILFDQFLQVYLMVIAQWKNTWISFRATVAQLTLCKT